MFHLSAIIEDLTNHGIRLQSLHEQIETDSLTGKFFCLMLGYVAEWELQAISDRTKDVKLGIVSQLNISTATIYSILKRNNIQINRKNVL